MRFPPRLFGVGSPIGPPRISSASAFVINTQGSGSAVFASAAVASAVLVCAGWEAVEESLLAVLHAVSEKKMAANKVAEMRGKVSIRVLLPVQVGPVN